MQERRTRLVPDNESDAVIAPAVNVLEPRATQSRTSPSTWLLSAFAVGLTLVTRVPALLRVEFPGHADGAYYVALARNLAEGRGYVIDYVWHFLVPRDSTTHYANDYWMPLPAAVFATFMRVFGATTQIALVPCMFACTWIGLTVALWVRAYGGSQTRCLWALGVSLTLPVIYKYSMSPESALLCAAFATTGLCVASLPRCTRAHWLLAGACSGLAHLSRQDGVLIFGAVGLAALVRAPAGSGLRHCGLVAGAHLLVVSPLVALNLSEAGYVLPPASLKVAFALQLEDMYRWNGVDSSRFFARPALAIASDIGATLLAVLGRAAAGTCYVGGALILVSGVRAARHAPAGLLVAPVALFALVFVVYGVVMAHIAEGGATDRCLLGLLPWSCALTAAFLPAPTPRWRMPLGIMAATGLGLAGAHAGLARVNGQNQVGVETRAAIRALDELGCRSDGDSQRAVMTRSPWQLHWMTRRPAVQIPNEPAAVIDRIARKYGVRCALVPSDSPAISRLARIPRCRWIGRVPGFAWEIYRFFETNDNEM